MKIQHLNKSFITKHFCNISDAECDAIRKEFFKKPSIDDVKSEMYNLYYRNGKVIGNIYSYYFYDLMSDCKLKRCKWSINEFLQSNDLIRYAVGKFKNCNKFYPSTNSHAKNLKILFRVGPSSAAGKLSNFPYIAAKNIIKKYDNNGNIFDYSCGWGSRLIAALNLNINYYGVDLNPNLVKSLTSMSLLFKKMTQTASHVDIRNVGSEIFIKDWINKMGLAFSSPPYFDLEDYNHKNKFTNKYPTYEEWLKCYWIPTVKNIYKYLTPDGIFILNIKNIKNFNLKKDMSAICIAENFKYISKFKLKNVNRIILSKNNKRSDEDVLIFKKTNNHTDSNISFW